MVLNCIVCLNIQILFQSKGISNVYMHAEIVTAIHIPFIKKSLHVLQLSLTLRDVSLSPTVDVCLNKKIKLKTNETYF